MNKEVHLSLALLFLLILIEVKASEALVPCSTCEIVLFSKEGCGPCVQLKKVLEELKIKYTEATSSSITVYPTLVVIKDNVEVSRIEGGKTKEELVALLNH